MPTQPQPVTRQFVLDHLASLGFTNVSEDLIQEFMTELEDEQESPLNEFTEVQEELPGNNYSTRSNEDTELPFSINRDEVRAQLVEMGYEEDVDDEVVDEFIRELKEMYVKEMEGGLDNEDEVESESRVENDGMDNERSIGGLVSTGIEERNTEQESTPLDQHVDITFDNDEYYLSTMEIPDYIQKPITKRAHFDDSAHRIYNISPNTVSGGSSSTTRSSSPQQRAKDISYTVPYSPPKLSNRTAATWNKSSALESGSESTSAKYGLVTSSSDFARVRPSRSDPSTFYVEDISAIEPTPHYKTANNTAHPSTLSVIEKLANLDLSNARQKVRQQQLHRVQRPHNNVNEDGVVDDVPLDSSFADEESNVIEFGEEEYPELRNCTYLFFIY